MKKKLFFICAAAIVVLAAVNVNLAFNSNSDIYLSLTSIEALARGETYYCSMCGLPVDVCRCPPAITCDYSSCHGKSCHNDTGIWWPCPCEANGDPLSLCML
jgi:hypothetical protein